MSEKHKSKNNFWGNSYYATLKGYAREMRNNSTKGEIKFWCELLRKRKTGYQFYRQKIIENYIVDFYCAKLKLVVEIDGETHEGKEKYDKERENKLKQSNLKVIRYKNSDVLYNFHFVVNDFNEQIKIREKELNIKNSPFGKGSTPTQSGGGI
ncbi:hypothetical protein BMS3Abin03_00070 [bacterium BMS3Abin03]|nr:hypothetical protein BMS3Abin03_00070 [bacterium BMS3Abin03]